MPYVALARVLFVCLLAGALLARPGFARDHFVAPQGAAATAKPNGDQDRPWVSVRQALRSGTVSGGDQLVLMEGHHGSLYIGKVSFDPPLKITAAKAGKVHVNSLRVETSNGLHFNGIGVWPLSPPPRPRPLVSASGNTQDIIFERMDIRGRADAPETYLRWRKEDWNTTWRSSGVVLAGTRNQLRHSKITGIGFAITLEGPAGLALGNVIEGFSGDGIRILGDGSAAVANRIENCFKTNANHDDGIQSWAPKSAPGATRAVTGLVLDANVILEWTARPDHPLRCRLQGIGFFDGFFDRTVIQNNLVVVNHYHGISLYGARGSRIVNNTVVHINGPGKGFPWILLEDHKSGAPAQSNLVANNAAMGYANRSADKSAMKPRTNAVVKYPVRLFMDPAKFDFRPRADSGYLDGGDADFAPDHDITGAPRPKGTAPDIGAFELK